MRHIDRMPGSYDAWKLAPSPTAERPRAADRRRPVVPECVQGYWAHGYYVCHRCADAHAENAAPGYEPRPATLVECDEAEWTCAECSREVWP